MTRHPHRIELVVDELVIRGLAPDAARAAAEGLERRLGELARHAHTALPARNEAFRRTGAVEAPAGSADAVGGAVAEAVWAALLPESARRAPGGTA